MSLILDALNRSRQDTDTVPGLATQHYSDSPVPAGDKVRQYLPWGALLLALGIIAWLLLDREPQPRSVPEAAPIAAARPAPRLPEPARETKPGEPVAQTRPATAVPEPAATVAAAPGAAPVESEPPATVPDTRESLAASQAQQALPATSRGDESVARLYQQPRLANPDPGRAGQAASPESQAVAAAAEPDTAASAGREEQPIDIEQLVLQARDELANANLEEHPTPFISALSQQTKDGIPTIYYLRHDYSGDSARSSVVLNGKTLKVGGTAAPGVRVEEILPDSVVLDYRGTLFRLRALNSWINL